MDNLTQKDLKAILNYDKETGIFTRKFSKRGSKINDIAGYTNKNNGYVFIMINRKSYRGHKLAWLYEYGFIAQEIDHINHNRSDNRIANLREVTRSENLRNKSKSTTISGHYGVYWSKEKKKWYSQIFIKSKSIHLGYSKSKEEAILKRKEAEKKHNYHPNHGKD